MNDSYVRKGDITTPRDDLAVREDNLLDIVSSSLAEDQRSKSKLTPRQQEFLRVLFDEAAGDYRTAMNLAGYAKNTPLSDVTTPLRDHIISAAKDYLALNTPLAVMKLLTVFSDPARPGNANIINTSKEILDRGGVLKATEVTQTTEVRNIFILPEKDQPKEITIDLEPEEYTDIPSEPDDRTIDLAPDGSPDFVSPPRED